MFQEIRALQALAALGNLGLELSHFEHVSHLKLLDPSPIHFLPEAIGPRVTDLRQLFVGEFGSLCLQLAQPTVGIPWQLPFLIFKYQRGPLIFTNVLVTHSRSTSGIRHTFSVIWAARVGKGLMRGLNAGRKGKMSLG